MKIIHADLDGIAGLDFEARVPDWSEDQIQMITQMDQTGTSLVLRDPAGRQLASWDGRQIDQLHRLGQLDPTRPETLKRSAIDCWRRGLQDPGSPKSFRLDLDACEDTPKLIGKLILLLNFLQERQELDFTIKRATPPAVPPQEPGDEPSSS